MKLIGIVLITVLIIIGYNYINISSQLNENINGEEKRLYFWVFTEEHEEDDFDYYKINYKMSSGAYSNHHLYKPILYVKNFLLYYDFTNNSGTISFILDETDISYTGFKIHFFAPVEIVDIYYIESNSITKGKITYYYKTPVDFDYKICGNYINETYNPMSYYKENISKFNEQKYTSFQITQINETLNRKNIVIEFKSDFEPDGTFSIITRNFNVVLSPSDDKENINFKLNNKYEPLSNNLIYLQNIVELPSSSDLNVKLAFTEDEINTIGIPYNRNTIKNDSIFKMNVKNRDIVQEKAFKMGLGISLLSSGIILLFKEIILSSSFFLFTKCIIDKFSKLRIKDICKSMFSYLKSPYEKTIEYFNLKNNIFSKFIFRTVCIAIVLFVLLNTFPHCSVDNTAYFSFLSDLIQTTVSLMGVLVIIAIYKIQSCEPIELFKQFKNKHKKIKMIKYHLSLTLSVGLFITVVFIILMYFTIYCNFLNDYNGFCSSVVVLFFFLSFLSEFCSFTWRNF